MVIEELRCELAPAGVKINLTETLLDKDRIAESNEIRMNGMLIEDLLAAVVVSTDRPSCGTLAGESTCCRAIEIGDERYEDIPPEMIRKAAYLALGVSVPRTVTKNVEPTKKELVIEWQHVGADISNTCERCAATGTSLHQVLKDLKPYFEQKNIHVNVKETVLPPEKLPDSNRILLTAKPWRTTLIMHRSSRLRAAPAHAWWDKSQLSAGQLKPRTDCLKLFRQI